MNFAVELNINNLASRIETVSIEGEDSFFSFDHWELPSISHAANGNILIWLGDAVYSGKQNKQEYIDQLANSFTYEKLLLTGGGFYVLYYNKAANELEILSSFGGILPIYYAKEKDKILVSSDIALINKLLSKPATVCSKYIAERLLFNYALTDDTLFNEIKRVPANTSLGISKEIYQRPYFRTESLFQEEPVSTSESYDQLSDLFIEISRKYINKGGDSILSFTSGFDGRTLLGISRKLGCNLVTYAFGSETSIDITIPKRQAAKLGVLFNAYLLDNKEYLNSSFTLGQEMIHLSSGEANFARAHYVHAAKDISRKTRYLLTGNFGSELFRAFHNTGVMCSKWLYQFFTVEDPLSLKGALMDAKELSLMSMESRATAINEIIADFKAQTWGSGDHKSLNRRFYCFVFEEMFRKYFGSEIQMQANYLYNRAPFLDLAFIRELFKTNIPGVYSDFFEHNPFKRFKGQLFYAVVLKKTEKELYRMKTGKGYRPSDLLSLAGKFNILFQKTGQKLKKPSTENDPFCVERAFKFNKPFYDELIRNNVIFKQEEFRNWINTDPTNTTFTALSILSYLKQING